MLHSPNKVLELSHETIWNEQHPTSDDFSFQQLHYVVVYKHMKIGGQFHFQHKKKKVNAHYIQGHYQIKEYQLKCQIDFLFLDKKQFKYMRYFKPIF